MIFLQANFLKTTFIDLAQPVSNFYWGPAKANFYSLERIWDKGWFFQFLADERSFYIVLS